jgi:hypothetical protein
VGFHNVWTGAGDLDECNGRRGVTSDYPRGRIVLMADYPFIPRKLRGEPDASFERQGRR